MFRWLPALLSVRVASKPTSVDKGAGIYILYVPIHNSAVVSTKVFAYEQLEPISSILMAVIELENTRRCDCLFRPVITRAPGSLYSFHLEETKH